jgi:hypothetical protein
MNINELDAGDTLTAQGCCQGTTSFSNSFMCLAAGSFSAIIPGRFEEIDWTARFVP